MANQFTSPWTEEMDDFLMEHSGSKSLTWIAKQLGRTPASVDRRVQRLGISDKHILTGTFTANQLATTLGVDMKVVVRWIRNKGLSANQGAYYTETVKEFVPKRHQRYFINIDKFWKWAEKNRDCLNWHRVPKNCLPPEPDWVEEQRKIDFMKGENVGNAWTPEQDRYLWDFYYKDNMTQKQIALLLGRTPSSVEKRLKRLREKRLVKS